MTFIVLILRHSNTSPKNVTSKTTQAVTGRRVAPLARVVAFVLLAFVTHSATIEIVHQHGQMLSSASARAASSVDRDTGRTSDESARPTGECLLCQLHQHLFQTLLVSAYAAAPTLSEEAFAGGTFIASLSENCTPRRGRAPPVSTLL
ncbi:MAG TPA: DUF2946 family protein [Pyrinomonadaceae bacterium]|nr:DUF2946 family protein [Pyrinomonadaceae bacterium]